MEQAETQDTPLPEENEQAAQDQEVEIVLEGDDAAPQDSVPMPAFKKRINKLTQREKDAKAEAEKLRQENELLRLQVKQGQKPKARPRLEDFDYDEGKYADAVDAYEQEQRKEFLAEVDKRIQSTKPEPQPDLKPLEAHYERAEKLKVSDYEAMEDAVLDSLGRDVFTEVVSTLAHSERVVYYLGKNPRKLDEISEMVRSGQGLKATVALGELQGQLKLRPRQTNTPEAESQIKGDAAPTSSAEWQKKIDAARAKGARTKEIIAMKAEAKAQGAKVE